MSVKYRGDVVVAGSRSCWSGSGGRGHRLNPRPSHQLGLRMIAWPPAGAIATFSVVAEVTVRVLTTTGV